MRGSDDRVHAGVWLVQLCGAVWSGKCCKKAKTLPANRGDGSGEE